MANEKMRDQNPGRDPNQGKEQEKGRAVGAGATKTQGQENLGRNPQGTESAGQGGGVQGTGQRNPNPTQGQRGQGTQGGAARRDESTGKRNPDQDEY